LNDLACESRYSWLHAQEAVAAAHLLQQLLQPSSTIAPDVVAIQKTLSSQQAAVSSPALI
jgi:hypothetical protein